MCGPASLVSLLGFYGLEKTEQELAELCGTDLQKGTSNQKLISALQNLGVNVLASENGTWEVLQNLIMRNVPALVGWQSEKEDHFSIVTDISDDEVTLMDPEIGQFKKIAKDEFMANWWDSDWQTGKVLKQWFATIEVVN